MVAFSVIDRKDVAVNYYTTLALENSWLNTTVAPF